MILPIDDNYRVVGNAYGWSIEKKRPYKKTSKWEPIKWFGSLEQAINGLGRLWLRTSDAETLESALLEVERISARLSRALDKDYYQSL
ncbi:MAG: hypothetical protein DIZ80_10445 [endosymbiont of Galathealinum brachiosum]|uniref:Uncharacterized protein n=1 Tax=endosymbiont of Galathealinum brachiosum TaxID=2200906 RepID=A0A370DDP0_9GAMM|nr:MAG: hypothetical protein DIZ80_10445 [endosymbiont of Galathealinum brachiosum]